MEVAGLTPYPLGLLLLPLLAMLLIALCVRCHEPPGEWGAGGDPKGGPDPGPRPQPSSPSPPQLFPGTQGPRAPAPVPLHPCPISPGLSPQTPTTALPQTGESCARLPPALGLGPASWPLTGCVSPPSSNPTSILIKPPYTPVPWPPAAHYPPVISYPPPSQPDLLPIPRSPQPPVGSHRMPPSQQDSDGANSMASYENQGASGISRPRARWGSWHLSQVMLTPVSLSPEPACEDADEDDEEDDYHNSGYLVVLPDSTPATGTAVPSAPVPSDPGLRDSTFSMEDYVNVPESGESTEASLAPLSSQEEGDEEEEGLPDYENLQELH
ncbi:linker for activation of T-cells family member 1 isoform X2 [Ictidomys tridecemlineatus]